MSLHHQAIRRQGLLSILGFQNESAPGPDAGFSEPQTPPEAIEFASIWGPEYDLEDSDSGTYGFLSISEKISLSA